MSAGGSIQPGMGGIDPATASTQVENSFPNKPTQIAHRGLFGKEFSTSAGSLTKAKWLDRFRPQVAGFNPPGDMPLVRFRFTSTDTPIVTEVPVGLLIWSSPITETPMFDCGDWHVGRDRVQQAGLEREHLVKVLC